MRTWDSDEVPVRYLLSRKRIVRAALELVDAEGLPALTMRRLAADLGVTPRALYRHLADKDDLLIAVCQEVLGEIRIRRDPAGSWQRQVRLVQEELRRALAAHPHVVPLLNRTSMIFAAGHERVGEVVVGALRDAGASPELAFRSAYALYNYVLGFATIEALPRMEGDDAATLAKWLADDVVDQAPALAEAGAPFLASFIGTLHTSDEQFALGLDLLLKGLDQEIRDRSAPSPRLG